MRSHLARKKDNRMRDIHIGKRESETANEEQLDKLRKTVRLEPNGYSVLVQTSGHVDGDVQISALDALYEMDERVVTSEKCWNGIKKKMLEISGEVN